MHDALADRSRVVYDPYTPEQQLVIRRQVEKFVAAQVGENAFKGRNILGSAKEWSIKSSEVDGDIDWGSRTMEKDTVHYDFSSVSIPSRATVALDRASIALITSIVCVMLLVLLTEGDRVRKKKKQRFRRYKASGRCAKFAECSRRCCLRFREMLAGWELDFSFYILPRHIVLVKGLSMGKGE